MPTAAPFDGLLYDPAVAGDLQSLTTPPYDQISPEEQDRYRHASPYNAVRLELATGVNGARGDRYADAATLLTEWRERGVLKEAGEPAVFPYEMDFRGFGVERRVRGVIVEIELEPYGGSIVPHEGTLPEPLRDRLALLRSVRANLSPVFGVFQEPSPELTAFLDGVTQRRDADRAVTDESGTRHSLWVAPEGNDVVPEVLRSRTIMVADGHHRYEVALAYREEMRAKHGPGPWDRLMILIVDAGSDPPLVLPFHRVLSGEAPMPDDARPVRDLQEVLAGLRDDDLTVGAVRMDGTDAVHLLGTITGEPPTVGALHAGLLAGLAGGDVRYVADAGEAEAMVRRGEGSAAYLLPATTVERIRGVVDSGRRLPEKSTYFWPKPRTGMVFRLAS